MTGAASQSLHQTLAALRYFTLDGTGHPSHKAQGSMIRRYIIWRNNHTADERLHNVVTGPASHDSGGGQAEDLPGTTFRTRINSLGRGETEAFVEDACTADGSTRVIGPEGDHLNGAWAPHEPAHCVRHQRTTDALPP
nr:hypothetical protein [Micromonospora craniellae]